MASDWRIIAWEPAQSPAELWHRYHPYRRRRAEEHDPTSPVSEDEVAEAYLREPEVWSIDHRYLVEAAGEIVGSCTISAAKPGSSGYDSNKHIMGLNMAVLAPWRRHGIGSAFLPEVARRMREHEATVLTVHSSEPDGQAFIEWFGGEQKMVERISRLYFEKIDWQQMDAWESALAERAPGTVLETYPVRLPDDFLDEYLPARQEMMNLMPFEDMEHGKIEMSREDFDKMYERLAIDESEHHTIISREPDGRISGITDVSWSPKQDGVVWQWFTGVHPDFRGRGLGKAIKAAMIRFVHERYEGLKWVSTGNAASNASMLAINTQMGFREHKVYRTYQIGRDKLERFVDERGLPALEL